ncbi:mucin-13-like isoform X2 [Hyla sarda]|uniref:mucin-13-like isoform X2 n=1 Tax=Hyla sarda TaxID=327740 RepID=UPI0024C21222|nr:mucin-13-like isoform X2 [Hyla sarda]
MGLTGTSGPSWWWLHVLSLGLLQHTWVISQESTPTNETHWSNVTTGPDQVHITSKETSGTPNTTLQTYWGNITTGPDQVHITSKETSGTPNTTLQTYWGNITTGPDQLYISNNEISGTPNTTLETYWGNVTTRPDQVYITSKETSRTPNTTLETYRGNVTTRPDQVYITSKETSRTPNTTLETYWGNVTTGPDQVYITNEETSRTPNTTLETYWGNVTTGLDQVHITSEETSRTPNTTLETYWGNITTRPDQVYITSEETSRSPNTTLETYRGNVTTGPDQVYITSEETSRTPNTTIEMNPSYHTKGPDLVYTITEEISKTLNNTVQTNMSNVTTGSDLVYNTSAETSVIPNTTEETYTSHVTTDLDYVTSETSNFTTGPGLAYVTSGITNFPLETYSKNATTGPDLNYIHEETSRTPNSTPEVYPSNVSSGSHLTYVTEDTIRIPNSTAAIYPSNVTIGPDQVYISEMSRTPNTTIEIISIVTTSPDLGYITEETTGTPYGNRTFYTGSMNCLQDADCPPYTVCTEQGGHHVCQCHLGSYFHHALGCVTARMFPAQIPSSVLYWDETSLNTSEYTNNEDESAQYLQGVHRAALLFQKVLGHVPGYLSTSITNVQLDEGLVTIVHSFSTLYPVTEEDLWGALSVSPLFCTEPHPGCVSPLSSDNYQGLSLCDFDVCDSSSSDCRSHGGLLTCECRRGYYKFSPTDRSCRGETASRACGSGFRRTENGCDRCPIGFGGFDCEESYLLIVIVESCVGCVLLVSLITLLVFYFRRKEPQKPTFIDSIILGVPTDQPSVRLPRAQFSWRREWEWNEPQEKVLADVHQQDGPAIHMKTFGDPARFSSPNTYHGRHNLSFISD